MGLLFVGLGVFFFPLPLSPSLQSLAVQALAELEMVDEIRSAKEWGI